MMKSMHSKSDNIEIIINEEAHNAIKEFFNSLKNRCQNNMESMTGSEFLFDYVQLLYYKCHKSKYIQIAVDDMQILLIR